MDHDRDTTLLPERLNEVLGTTYGFERELGRGGMSRVFVAVEKRFGRRVVVKVLASDLAAGVSADRFAREVQLAARLQQANIVPVFDAGQIDGLPYYTMPWIEGESLRVRLDARGALSISESVAIIADVARALSYAHAHGVVHRDIKPDNILLSGHTAVVTDFGIAKAISLSRDFAPYETLTEAGTSLGTPAYMAPEQAMGDPATDHRADLYALGVVSYELLAGQRPFTGSTAHELVRAHVTQSPPDLAARRPDLPPALAALVMRCLAKEPAVRPQSADEVLGALERAHDVSWGGAHVANAPTAAAAPTRRRSRAWIAAIAAPITVLAVAGWLWSRRSPPPVEPLDRGRVLVAAPSAVDPAARDLVVMTQTAVTRALGTLPSVRLAEASVPAATTTDANIDAAATRAAREAQAGFVVTTNVFPLGADSARLEMRVLDAATGDLVRAVPPIGVARAASDSAWTVALDPLLSTVAIATFPALGPRTIPLGPPPRYAAVRELLLSLAITRADSDGRATAAPHYARATSLDSTFLQPRLWRAATMSLGAGATYNRFILAVMDTTIATIGPQRERLNPFESLLLDYVTAARQANQGAMLAVQRRMYEMVPEAPISRDLPYRLLDVNRPREAIAFLERARPTHDIDGKLVQPSESPLHWLTLADAYHYLGDHRAERDAAAQLRRLRPDALSSLRYQLRAAAALGDSAAVEALLAAARTLPSAPQGYDFFGDLALQTSQELTAHGHDRLSPSVRRRAFEWFESRRPEERPWRVQLRHTLALHVSGNAAAALDSLRAISADFNPASPTRVGLAGRIAAVRGDTAEARRIDAQLAAMGNGLGGVNTLDRAFIASLLGRKDEAVTLLEEAFAQGLPFNLRWRLHWFTDLEPLWGDPRFRKMLEAGG